MTLKTFIEKAVEGGWLMPQSFNVTAEGIYPVYSIFLDPKLWQAVGKVEGWIREDGTDVAKYIQNDPKRTSYPLWKWHMHAMLNFICEGGTPEQFIETL
jgi:hypothetical protein